MMRWNSGVLPLVGLMLAGLLAPAGAQQPAGGAAGEGRDQAEQREPPKPATIRVTGAASTTVAADLARVNLAVESHEKTAAGASQANADAMSSVLTAIRGAQLAGLHIETYGYTLSPVYTSVASPDGGRAQKIEGYRVVNNVRATLTDLKSVGRLIDVATAAGANRVSGISFEASDPSHAEQEILAEAVHRAREQAETIAAALGRQLGAPLEVEGGAETPSPRPVFFGEVARASLQTPIEPRGENVNAHVTITFALGPERASR